MNPDNISMHHQQLTRRSASDSFPPDRARMGQWIEHYAPPPRASTMLIRGVLLAIAIGVALGYLLSR